MNSPSLTKPTAQSTKAFISNPYFVLFVSVIAFSFAAILVRQSMNAGIEPIMVSAGRLLLAALMLTPIVWTRYRHDILNVRRITLFGAIFAGIFQGLHFISIAFSLENTSVVMNQTLISTSPIFIALLEVLVLKQKFPKWLYVGIFVTIFGGIIIAFASGADSASGANPPLGNALALLAAVLAAFYIFAGRVNRRHVSILPYIWIVYLSGGITSLIAALLTGTQILGYSADAYFWLVMTALVPQMIGHSGMNYAVGYIPATITTLATQIIVLTSGILAFFLFQELPTGHEVIGITVTVSGVVLALVAQTRSGRKRKT
ncbi:MAG: hypothetical protein CL607_15810 [Anaerolineaceae bacterium]|nr:hypothetical protein [Anaerolineaceae bacterium]